MPIRFRCAYCNQLMGISLRKAGTVVRCPKCAGEIIVPSPEPPDPLLSKGGHGGVEPAEQQAGPAALDDPNFEQIFAQPGKDDGATAAAPTSLPPIAVISPDPPTTEIVLPPRRLGLFVSIGMLVVFVGIVILLLILMFVLGLIIGRASALPA
jgi:DNA-directed RNA polymerase subunit RPC12/RpoP